MKKAKFLYWVAICGALLVSTLAWAADHNGYENGPPPLPVLDDNISILLDPSFQLTLNDILAEEQQEHFRPSSANLSLGYLRSALWLRLTLHSEITTDATLTMAPNFLDYVDVFVAAEGDNASADGFTHHASGDHRPIPADGLSALASAVPIALERDKATTVYIRIANTNSSTDVALRLEGPAAQRAGQLVTVGVTYGIWFGGMAILLAVQLVFFYFDRRAKYPLLALSTLGVMLIYVGNLGFSHAFLFRGNGPANDFFIGFNAWAGLAASALAYASILELNTKMPWAYRLYLAMAGVGLVGAIFAALGLNIIFVPVGTTTSAIGAIITMAVSLRLRNTEGAASRITAAAFVIVGLGASITMIQRLGVAWLPTWIFQLYGISTLIQTLLLTGALAVRLRDAENRNRNMQLQATRTAQAAERVAADLIEERTKELVVARRAAEDALRTELESQTEQVRFLEVVSHQYRTPLAAIRSNIDGIGLELPPGDEKNQTRIARIRRAILRLVEILEVNLARSRLQGPAFLPQMKLVDISAVVAGAQQRAGDLFSGVEIKLLPMPEAAHGPILGDAEMLELALINLLENAVKYTALKGARPITMAVEARPDTIVITVSDHGIGIPPDDLPQVFEGSARGSNAQSVEGSGLGLFLVAKIATAHGGWAEIESVLGERTDVRIHLPRNFEQNSGQAERQI